MRTNTTLNILTLGAALLAVSPLARAKSNDSLVQTLQGKYPLTKLTDDKTGVVTAGVVLTLRTDGLKMTQSGSMDLSGNAYKNGRITQNKVSSTVDKGKSVCKKIPFMNTVCPADPPAIQTRTFVTGEKLYATKIFMKDASTVAFELYSVDPHFDVYYWTTLTFPFDSGAPSIDQVMNTIAEVFSAPASETQSATPATQAEPQFKPDDPPPPPDAAPTTLSMGDTIDQVVKIYGQPITTAKANGKMIYVYKDIKVTFVDGKVADVQ